MRITAVGLVCVGLWSCGKSGKPQADRLFEALPAQTTGIGFTNQVENTAQMNIFNYRNFYNGGGVAIGDLNNDGLPDVYLTSNTDENKLYLNKGNFTFEDITGKAGVAGKQAWSTGVTLADVNVDGLLDIYVCNAGDVNGDNRKNELFINNGNLTFTEQAARYGLADEGYSTHAAFFDYDRDGDLDCYLLSNSSYPVSRLGYANLRSQRDSLGGHKLFRNDGPPNAVAKSGSPRGGFTDASERAGIYGSLIGFGLGITIGDLNDDNWLDIYISNDFYERDYLYINNQDGTFTESVKDQMQHLSLSSMGADVADINNDGNLDVFVTDMLPGDDVRLKTTSTYENYDLEQLKVSRDFHHQYMQNTLQLNNGNGTFSEVARLAGVHATDWSWGALIFDMDNDGLKDIFVANGINKNLTDQDFVNFLGEEETMQRARQGGGYAYNQELIGKMSSSPLPNYAFRNEGNLRFANKAAEWGLDAPGFSNGAAYGDLDNDGDLDLIVNNVNQPVSVFRNLARQQGHGHYLRVKLKGAGNNPGGIGTKVYVHQPTGTQYLQQMPNRGFQSSVDLVMLFGLGNTAAVDSVTVVWPDDKMQVLRGVKADAQLVVEHQEATQTFVPRKEPSEKFFYDVTDRVQLEYQHEENAFVDYNRDPMLKQMYSTLGPALATADVNGDGLEDVYLGGASQKRKSLFLQGQNGTFRETAAPALAADSIAEDVDAVFFDADGDKDQDLFVVTGGNEFTPGEPALLDRLYLNDGKGNFVKDTRLPNLAESGACVAAADFDRDGDVDLFVGGRSVPGQYGFNPPSFLYVNDGTGAFKNYTKRYLEDPALGMVTDAEWADVDGDQYPELVVAGDWMPVIIFKNNRGKLVRDANWEIPHSAGWWNCIKPADVDGDKDIDFVLGNWGRNSRVTASVQQPAELYVHDFDKNGSVEQIISCYTENGKPYPMVLKHELQKQVPMVKKRFVKFADFAGKQINEVFTEEELKGALVKRVYEPNTSLLLNEGGRFSLRSLPVEAQFSPVFGIESIDYNHDGIPDLVLTGNFYDVLPELGRYDASYGVLLRGEGKGNFKAVSPRESGLLVRGQVRKTRLVRDGSGRSMMIIAKNGGRAQVLRYREPGATQQMAAN